jgi:hypothetical protein
MDTKLREGDVIGLSSGEHVVISVNPSGAAAVPLTAQSRTVTNHVTGESATFNAPGQIVHLADTLPRDYVKRRGEAIPPKWAAKIAEWHAIAVGTQFA